MMILILGVIVLFLGLISTTPLAIAALCGVGGGLIGYYLSGRALAR